MRDLTTRDPREVRALREELPDEAVGVFVRAPLPGTMRVGEVDLDARLLSLLQPVEKPIPAESCESVRRSLRRA